MHNTEKSFKVHNDNESGDSRIETDLFIKTLKAEVESEVNHWSKKNKKSEKIMFYSGPFSKNSTAQETLSNLAMQLGKSITGDIQPAPKLTEQSKEKQATTPSNQKTPSMEMSYPERKIKEAVDELRRSGVVPTGELIASKLPIGPKGKPYTRETVSRKLKQMRKRGIDV